MVKTTKMNSLTLNYTPTYSYLREYWTSLAELRVLSIWFVFYWTSQAPFHSADTKRAIRADIAINWWAVQEGLLNDIDNLLL